MTTTPPTTERPAGWRHSRAAARIVFLAGAVAIGLFLFRAAPRDVTLVYGLGGEAVRALDVDVERGGQTFRHAEFRFASGAPSAVTHHVRLTDGDYVVRVTIATDRGTRRAERPIHVGESGTIVIPLGS